MILTILALGFIIYIHEFGHFLAAKAVKVHVEEFSVGFGKKLLSKKINGTEYSLKILLLGGYVKLSDSFRECRPRTRIFVGLAGPAVNLLFAFLMFVLVSIVGLPTLTTKIGTVFPDHPAAKAGILPGDRIVAVEGHPVSRWLEMTNRINDGKKSDLKITAQRDQDNIEFIVRPELREGRGAIGIKASGESVSTRYGLNSGIQASKYVAQHLKSSVDLIVQLLTFKGGDVAGPVKILQIGKEQAEFGAISFLNLVSILSVNFFVFNLVPIPVLDGGLILLAVIEASTGLRINRRFEAAVTRVGLAIIIGLMMFVFLSDLTKLLPI